MSKETNKKYLLIHIDDIGMSDAANEAAKALILQGFVKSGSIMMPCSYADEFIQWSKAYSFDLGIHLTHTCEWDINRWQPLSDKTLVPTLLDKDQFMWKENSGLKEQAIESEYYLEGKAQIMKAYAQGFYPSHLDSHMFTNALKDGFFEAFITLAAEHNLIPFVPDWMVQNERCMQVIRKHNLFYDIKMISTGDYTGSFEDKKKNFYKQLENLNKGIYMRIIHPIIETSGIKKMIPGWQNRYFEYELFMDMETQELMNKLEIEVISWKG